MRSGAFIGGCIGATAGTLAEYFYGEKFGYENDSGMSLAPIFGTLIGAVIGAGCPEQPPKQVSTGVSGSLHARFP